MTSLTEPQANEMMYAIMNEIMAQLAIDITDSNHPLHGKLELPLKIVGDNQKDDSIKNYEKPWIKLKLRVDKTGSITIGGGVIQHQGAVTAAVFTPLNEGEYLANHIARVINIGFSELKRNGLSLYVGSSVSHGQDGKWNQILVDIPAKFCEYNRQRN